MPAGAEIVDADSDGCSNGGSGKQGTGSDISATAAEAGRQRHSRRYSRDFTEAGDAYYMPIEGGESTWVLPEGATVVECSEKYRHIPS